METFGLLKTLGEILGDLMDLLILDVDKNNYILMNSLLPPLSEFQLILNNPKNQLNLLMLLKNKQK